jgi:hypothetical protein
MPLVHVHGVATRPTNEYEAFVKQRDALYKALVFDNKAVMVRNPDWGSHAVQFSKDLRWLPKPSGNERFAAGDDPAAVSAKLGTLATQDAAQAIDLAVMAALEQQVKKAVKVGAPELAADPATIDLATVAADLQAKEGLLEESPKGLDSLRADSDAAFATTLGMRLDDGAAQAFGIGDKLKDAVRSIGGVIGNAASDLALRAVRATSAAVYRSSSAMCSSISASATSPARPGRASAFSNRSLSISSSRRRKRERRTSRSWSWATASGA